VCRDRHLSKRSNPNTLLYLELMSDLEIIKGEKKLLTRLFLLNLLFYIDNFLI